MSSLVLPPDPRNRQRVTWAAQAIEGYAKEVGLSIDVDRDTAVRDLLGDLMHYCEAWGVDFDGQLELAYGHYDAETVECEQCGLPHDPDSPCPKEEGT